MHIAAFSRKGLHTYILLLARLPLHGSNSWIFSNINDNDKIHDTERTDTLEFRELSKILPITTKHYNRSTTNDTGKNTGHRTYRHAWIQETVRKILPISEIDQSQYRLMRNGTLAFISPTNPGLGSIPLPLSTFVSNPSLVSSTKFLTTTHNTVYKIKVFVASIYVDKNIPWFLQ